MIFQLELLDFINGFFSLIFVLVSITVAIRILSKYFRYKDKIFLYVGISWIGIVSPWFSSSTALVYYLITQQEVSQVFYLLIGLVFIPVVLVIWFTAVSRFLFSQKYHTPIIAFYILVGLGFEIFLFTFLFINPDIIGVKVGIFDINYSIGVVIYLLLNVLIFFISGLLFGNESLKSEDPEVKLKGKLLIVAFIVYFIGALLDAAIPLTPITLVIIRLILIGSAVLFDFGFFFPKFVKRLFIREE